MLVFGRLHSCFEENLLKHHISSETRVKLMPPKLLGLHLCWHSAGEAGRGTTSERPGPLSIFPLHPLTLLSLLLLSQCCWDKTLWKKPQLCCPQNPPRHCECRACSNEQDTSLPSSQGDHFSKDWKWDSISIKFQLCEISYIVQICCTMSCLQWAILDCILKNFRG